MAIVVGVYCNKLYGFDQRSCATSDPVSTRMGDRLWTGKPFRYVTSQIGKLSLSYPYGVYKSSTNLPNSVGW